MAGTNTLIDQAVCQLSANKGSLIIRPLEIYCRKFPYRAGQTEEDAVREAN